MPSITLEWTLSIVAAGNAQNFVTEFDCVLDIEVDDSDEYPDFSVESVDFTKSGNSPAFTVSEKSDPDLWKLIERAIDRDQIKIADKVVEYLIDEKMSRLADRADHYRDMMMDR